MSVYYRLPSNYSWVYSGVTYNISTCCNRERITACLRIILADTLNNQDFLHPSSKELVLMDKSSRQRISRNRANVITSDSSSESETDSGSDSDTDSESEEIIDRKKERLRKLNETRIFIESYRKMTNDSTRYNNKTDFEPDRAYKVKAAVYNLEKKVRNYIQHVLNQYAQENDEVFVESIKNLTYQNNKISKKISLDEILHSLRNNDQKVINFLFNDGEDDSNENKIFKEKSRNVGRLGGFYELNHILDHMNFKLSQLIKFLANQRKVENKAMTKLGEQLIELHKLKSEIRDLVPTQNSTSKPMNEFESFSPEYTSYDNADHVNIKDVDLDAHNNGDISKPTASNERSDHESEPYGELDDEDIDEPKMEGKLNFDEELVRFNNTNWEQTNEEQVPEYF